MQPGIEVHITEAEKILSGNGPIGENQAKVLRNIHSILENAIDTYSKGSKERNKIAHVLAKIKGRFLGLTGTVGRRKYMDKRTFILSLSEKFVYKGYRKSLKEHLHDIFIKGEGSWTGEVEKLFKSYNNTKDPIPRIPEKATTIGLCLLEKHTRIAKIEFCRICGIEIGASILRKPVKVRRSSITLEKAIQILANSDNQRKLGEIFNDSIRTQWTKAVMQLFQEINESGMHEQKLPKSMRGIALLFNNGQKSITKEIFKRRVLLS